MRWKSPLPSCKINNLKQKHKAPRPPSQRNQLTKPPYFIFVSELSLSGILAVPEQQHIGVHVLREFLLHAQCLGRGWPALENNAGLHIGRKCRAKVGVTSHLPTKHILLFLPVSGPVKRCHLSVQGSGRDVQDGPALPWRRAGWGASALPEVPLATCGPGWAGMAWHGRAFPVRLG